MSFSKSVSSSSISPVSRTTKMSVQSFKTRSTQGSSSNMMDLEIPLKNSLTNFPMTSTTDMYRPTILKKRSGGRKQSILLCHVGKMYTKQSCTVGPGAYPCPARKPRLEGLTLSLNITISMLWQLWSEAEVHSSTTHHWSACPSDATVICWSLMDIGLKKSRSGRSECSAGKQARVSSHQDYPIQKYIYSNKILLWHPGHYFVTQNKSDIICIQSLLLTYFHPGCHFGLWSFGTPDELWQEGINNPTRQGNIVKITLLFILKSDCKKILHKVGNSTF